MFASSWSAMVTVMESILPRAGCDVLSMWCDEARYPLNLCTCLWRTQFPRRCSPHISIMISVAKCISSKFRIPCRRTLWHDADEDDPTSSRVPWRQAQFLQRQHLKYINHNTLSTRVICDKKPPVKVMDQIYKTAINPNVTHGAECWLRLILECCSEYEAFTWKKSTSEVNWLGNQPYFNRRQHILRRSD